MATREQQLVTTLRQKIAEMTEIQRAYLFGQVSMDEINRMWVRREISSELRDNIQAQFERVDELRRLAQMARITLDQTIARQTARVQSNADDVFNTHQQVFQRQQEDFHRQQMEHNNQFHHGF